MSARPFDYTRPRLLKVTIRDVLACALMCCMAGGVYAGFKYDMSVLRADLDQQKQDVLNRTAAVESLTKTINELAVAVGELRGELRRMK